MKPMTWQEADTLLKNPGVASALDAIAGPESSGRYNVIHGGAEFADFSDHPWSVMGENGPWKTDGKGRRMTASGRYQIIHDTYQQHRDVLNPNQPAFGPENQDRLAVALLYRGGAIDPKTGQLKDDWRTRMHGTWEGLKLEDQKNANNKPRPFDNYDMPGQDGKPLPEPTPNEIRDDGAVEAWKTTQLPNIVDFNTRMSGFNDRRNQMRQILSGMNAPVPVEPIKDPYENKYSFVGAILRGKTDEAIAMSSRVAAQNAAIQRQNINAEVDFEMKQLGLEQALLGQEERGFMERWKEVAYGSGGGGRVNSRYGNQSSNQGGPGVPGYVTPGKTDQYGKVTQRGEVDMSAEPPFDPARPDRNMGPEQKENWYRQQAAHYLNYDADAAKSLAVMRQGMSGLDSEGKPLKGKALADARESAIQEAFRLLGRRDIPQDKQRYLIDALKDEFGEAIFDTPREEVAGSGERSRTQPGPPRLVAGEDGKLREEVFDEDLGTYTEDLGPTRRKQHEAFKDSALFTGSGETSLMNKMLGDDMTEVQKQEVVGQGWDIAAKSAANSTYFLSSDEVSSVAATAASFIDTSYTQPEADAKPLTELVTGERKSTGERRRLTKNTFTKRIQWFLKNEANVYGEQGGQLKEMLRNVGSRRSGVVIRELYENVDMDYIRSLNKQPQPAPIPQGLQDYFSNPDGVSNGAADLTDDQYFDALFGAPDPSVR